ncbi:MAG: hypothetical protein Kow0054_16580 [Deferrisoma sp.]
MERRAWLLQWPDAALTHGRNQAPCRAPGMGVCLGATWYETLAIVLLLATPVRAC